MKKSAKEEEKPKKMPCNQDCFNCSYSDCIADDITKSEMRRCDDKVYRTSEKARIRQRAYYRMNRQKIIDRNNAYRKEHMDKYREYSRKYKENNREEINAKRRRYYLESKLKG